MCSPTPTLKKSDKTYPALMGISLKRKTKVAHKPRSVIVLERFCLGEGVAGGGIGRSTLTIKVSFEGDKKGL